MIISSLSDYRLLGRSGLRVSPLCLGTMTFGTEWGWGSGRAECRRILDQYIDAGGNFIDTANFYTNGASETMLGQFLKGRRATLVLGTKYSLAMRKGDPNAGGNQRKSLAQAIEASLKRLQTDYIDLYWVHIWDRLTPIEEVMRGLDDLVRAGKILYVGVSDMPAWKVAQANTIAQLRGWSPFVGLQAEYSLVERTAERDLIPMALDLGLGVMPWAPLGASILSGKYDRRDLEAVQASSASSRTARGARPIVKRLTERNIAIVELVSRIADELGRSVPQVALRWLLQQPGVTSVILGARLAKQLRDNLGCLSFTVSESHCKTLNEATHTPLGFPHDFIARDTIVELITGGCRISH